MQRFHVHVRVRDIESAVPFYSTLFGAKPGVLKSDYAKWMLDDPRVNFAISALGDGTTGIDHVGIQVEKDTELRELAGRLKSAGEMTLEEESVTCCYARGNKSWVNDPAGVRWETFFTFGDATTYGEDRSKISMAEAANATEGSCQPDVSIDACCAA